jgi:hypothetical protein
MREIKMRVAVVDAAVRRVLLVPEEWRPPADGWKPGDPIPGDSFQAVFRPPGMGGNFDSGYVAGQVLDVVVFD